MNSRLAMAAAAIGMLFLAGTGPSRATQSTLNFESGTLAGARASGNPPTVQGAIKRNGRYAMRSYLNRFQSRVPYRTEASVTAYEPRLNQEYWYSFSIYLPNDFVPDPIWETVAQWHGRPDSGEASAQPPISLRTTNGVWKLQNQWTSDRITTRSNTGSRSFTFGPYARGRWTDWVFRIKWSYGSQGILEVWQNGKKVVSVTGPNTYNDAHMPYFKMGIYKGWMPGAPAGNVSQRVLYHDEFHMVGPGGSYAAVAQASSPTTLQAPSQFIVE